VQRVESRRRSRPNRSEREKDACRRARASRNAARGVVDARANAQNPYRWTNPNVAPAHAECPNAATARASSVRAPFPRASTPADAVRDAGTGTAR